MKFDKGVNLAHDLTNSYRCINVFLQSYQTHHYVKITLQIEFVVESVEDQYAVVITMQSLYLITGEWNQTSSAEWVSKVPW